MLHTKFLFVLTRVLVHGCRIWGQESRFDNFECVSYAQNVKVVTRHLFTQKTQTWERLLVCCVWRRPQCEDTGSIKCRAWVVPVCTMKACRRHKGLAPLILSGCTGWGECKHHVPAVLHQRQNTGTRLIRGCVGLRTNLDFRRWKNSNCYKYFFLQQNGASPIFSSKKLSTLNARFF